MTRAINYGSGGDVSRLFSVDEISMLPDVVLPILTTTHIRCDSVGITKRIFYITITFVVLMVVCVTELLRLSPLMWDVIRVRLPD